MFKWLFAFFEKKPEGDKICDCGCGVSQRMLPYNHDVHDTNLMLKNKGPVNAKAQAFYADVGLNSRKAEPDSMHGADSLSCVYRGPGGPGCGD